MARKNKLETSRLRIISGFDSFHKSVFTDKDLRQILATKSQDWGLPKSLSFPEFTQYLIQKKIIHGVRFKSPYKSYLRYLRPGAGTYEAGQSLGRGAYLSHGTAVFLHGLTQELPSICYVNIEQSKKPRGSQLTQEGLDRAFASNQRKSKHVVEGYSWKFLLLSGKHTGRFEVGLVNGPNGEIVEATKLERTLIDITVRPLYAGGVFKISEAFEVSRDRLSVSTLLATLKGLDHVYPYHQAIGFYMERSGFPQSECQKLRDLGLKYDFYLAHAMQKTRYVKDWRLSVPEQF